MKKLILSALIATLMIATIACTSFTAIAAHQQQMNFQKMTIGSVSVSGTVYGLPLDLSGPIPLADAQVFIGGGKLKDGITFAIAGTTTNQNGYYQFENIPIGTYIVLARKPGEYFPGFRLVTLTEGNPVKHNVDIYLIHRLGLIGGDGGNQYMSTVMTMIPEGQHVLFE